MVRAPVGHHPPGVLPVITPVGKMLVHAPGAEDGVVRPCWSRAQPHVPIEAWFQRFLRKVAGTRGAANIDDHLLDFSDPSVADEFTSFAELAHRSLHGTGLKDPIVFAGCLNHGPRFMNG